MSSSQAPVPPSPERMAAVLSAIAAQARQTNRGRAADLGAALERARSGGLDADGWAAAELTAHQLAGSAGTFGYAGVSELAASLERLLAGSRPGGLDHDQLHQAQTLLDQLSGQLAGQPDPD